MKIRFLQGCAGPVVYQKGEEVDLDPREAARWIASGLAESIDTKTAAAKTTRESKTVKAADRIEKPPRTRKKRKA